VAVIAVARKEAETSLSLSAGPISAADELEHLRRLLDKQPSCLMRVGADGMLLAVNDAALSLLGAETLAQVLETAFTDRLVPEHHGLWRDFIARVFSDGSASLDCDMVDRSGVVRSVRLQGNAITDHPDGIRSMILGARDLTATRRLELALQDQEVTGKATEQLRNELAEANAARASAAAAAEESQRAAEALRGELERSLAAQGQMTDGIVQRDHDRRQIETALKRRDEESQFLQAAIERYEADHQRLEAEVDRAIGDGRRVQAELEQAQAILGHAQREVSQAHDELALARAEREKAHSEREQLRAELEQLRNELEQARSEHEEFSAMVKHRDVTRQKMLAEHATARMQAERALADASARQERLAKQIEMLAREFAPTERSE
jgi:PAS domain S-box-containing protein